jgi:hypothetical protein
VIREAILETAGASAGLAPTEAARLAILKDCVAAIVLRSFHESGAFGSVALRGAAARRMGSVGEAAGEGAGSDLEFILLYKAGYAPERWLFKAQRYLRFSGLEAKIAFARRGELHSGWVKVGGLLESGTVDLRIVVDAGFHERLSTEVRIVSLGGEHFGVRTAP